MAAGVAVETLSPSDWTQWMGALAAGVACGAVSPLVVQRRWAFLGEAIGHSGYGGAGVVWLLAALLPGVAILQSVEAAMAGVLLAALAVAVGIGLVGGGDNEPDRHQRQRRTDFDVVVGLFLVGTLALGLLASRLYEVRLGARPARADSLLFGGGVSTVGITEAALTLAVALAVAVGLRLYRREVLAWSIDPTSARLSGLAGSGTRLAVLVAVAASAALAARLTGAILVTALLVLPGATATRCGRTLRSVWLISLATSAGAVASSVLLKAWLPPGPTVVVVLIAAFGAGVLAGRRS